MKNINDYLTEKLVLSKDTKKKYVSGIEDVIYDFIIEWEDKNGELLEYTITYPERKTQKKCVFTIKVNQKKDPSKWNAIYHEFNNFVDKNKSKFEKFVNDPENDISFAPGQPYKGVVYFNLK